MKKCALYARTSTENQEKEETIESQIAEIEETIEKEGNVLLPNCRFIDSGWSGELLARPALDEMRDSARKGSFDCVYIYDRGRLSRKYVHQEIIIEELEELKVKVISLHDTNADDAEGKIIQGFQGLFAEYEKVKIAERMRRGKLYKVRQGKLLGYSPKYGYSYVPKQGTENGYFLVNDIEAEVVRRIFFMHGAQEMSINKIIRVLYKEKVQPPKQMNDSWSRSTICRMLRDESYIGNHYYYKSQASIPRNPRRKAGEYTRVKRCSRISRPKSEWMAVKIPPIIEKELFDKVQKQILLNGKYASRNRKRDYLLPGLVYCTCGLKRVGETSSDHKHIYYRCAERIYKHPHPRQCFEKSVNARMLDKLVMEKVLKIFSNEDLIRRQAERWIKTTKTSDNYERELELKNHKIELLNAEEEKYLKAYGAGITSFEVYESRMKDLNSRRDHLKNEQNELKLAIVKLDNKPSLDIDLICQKALDTINNFDLEDKQLFLRKTLDKVVTNQEQAIVYGFIPINLDKGDKNVGFQIKHRHRRLTKCRQINTI